MSAPAELPNEFDRYRILKKLGQGGMGAVYLAEDKQLGRRVALKVPHFSDDDGPTAIERFHREARVAAAIEHSNICPVYEIGESNGVHYYLTMPFIDGTPLSEKVNQEQPLPPVVAADLVRRLALAVGMMHELALIHRDLKPGNVLLRPNGDPIIMDFGLARSIGGTGRLTAMGTPAYMSPEQIMGQADLGPATDVYSPGVIRFELLTGRLPFVGTFHAVYGQILHSPVPVASHLRPGLDPRLDTICLKAMAKTPAERFATSGTCGVCRHIGRRSANDRNASDGRSRGNSRGNDFPAADAESGNRPDRSASADAAAAAIGHDRRKRSVNL